MIFEHFCCYRIRFFFTFSKMTRSLFNFYTSFQPLHFISYIFHDFSPLSFHYSIPFLFVCCLRLSKLMNFTQLSLTFSLFYEIFTTRCQLPSKYLNINFPPSDLIEFKCSTSESFKDSPSCIRFRRQPSLLIFALLSRDSRILFAFDTLPPIFR